MGSSLICNQIDRFSGAAKRHFCHLLGHGGFGRPYLLRLHRDWRFSRAQRRGASRSRYSKACFSFVERFVSSSLASKSAKHSDKVRHLYGSGLKFRFNADARKESRYQVAHCRSFHLRIFGPRVPHQMFAHPLPACVDGIARFAWQTFDSRIELTAEQPRCPRARLPHSRY
jgi:hypothetical protein